MLNALLSWSMSLVHTLGHPHIADTLSHCAALPVSHSMHIAALAPFSGFTCVRDATLLQERVTPAASKDTVFPVICVLAEC